MPSSLGLEAMNSIKPELNWKTVKKGRRTRKSVARNLNGIAKICSLISPERVGDFSGSDSDKIGEVVHGQSLSGIPEYVPVKKPRCLRKSSSTHLWTPSLQRQDSASPKTHSSLFEGQKQLLCSNGQRSSDWQVDGIKKNSEIRCDEGFCSLILGDLIKRDSGDFSGIELLAAAASMDYDNDDANKQDLVAEDSVMTKDPDTSDSASLSGAGLKKIESENPSSDDVSVNCGNTDCSPVLSNSAAASQSLCGSSVDGTMPNVSRQYWDLNTPMDAWVEPCDDMKMEERYKACGDHVLYNPARKKDEYSDPKIDESKLSPIEGQEIYNSVTITDSKLSCSSGLLIFEEKIKSTDIGAKILNEDCSSDISDQCKDNKDSKRTSEPPGTFMQDAPLAVAIDSSIHGNCLSGSTISDSQVHLLVDKHEDTNLANESTMNGTEDSSKSSSDEVLTGSVGKIGSATGVPCNLDVSWNNHENTFVGDDLTGFEAGYDSPYEDGELRGSVLYSWEENEIENECVDYESDGRNGDGLDDADYYSGPNRVEGGSEGSPGLLAKGFSGGNSKGELAEHEMAGKGSNAGSGATGEQSMGMLIDENKDCMRRSQLTDRRGAFDGKLRQMGGYASKTARGRPHSRIQGRSSIGATNGKDGFFLQQCRSRRGDSYHRSERDFSLDKYPGRYNNRPNTHFDRDRNNQWGSRKRYNNTPNYQGADGRTYTRSRNKTGDQADMIGGLDFRDPPPRQTGNYFPKGLNRSFMRRSPVERDCHSGPGRRMPPTRGGGRYRGRGHYSQCGGRNYRENEFEVLPDDVGPLSRIPQYISNNNRDQSFSPCFGRNPNMAAPLPRRRSRSRSRTRSPRLWYNHPHREQRAFGNNNRRNNNRSRSPDFMTEARMERSRLMPFSKPNYRDGGYVSPQRNGRWVDDRSHFGEDNYARRRSPVRVFNKRGLMYDSKTDECYSPSRRRPPGRFSFMANGGRERKLERDYDDRRRCENGGGKMMERDPSRGDGGCKVKRHRRDVVDDFKKCDLNDNNSNKKREGDVPKEVAEAKGEVTEEDKRASEV